MAIISTRIQINAPREKVWEVLADLGDVAAYNPSVRTSQLTSESNGGVGATRRLELYPKGYIDEKIMSWTEGQGYSVSAVAPPGPLKKLDARWSLRPDGNGTVVTVDTHYRLRFGPFGALLDVLGVGSRLRKTSNKILSGLKYRVESGDAVAERVPKLPVPA